MNLKWSQPYPGESRYERLYRAQRILQLSRHAMLLDTVEPVTDLTDAKEYLKKLPADTLKKEIGDKLKIKYSLP
jgi:hypothetical protein